jgi:hypothetical protein
MNIAVQDISHRLKTGEDEAFFARLFYAYAPVLCIQFSAQTVCRSELPQTRICVGFEVSASLLRTEGEDQHLR